MRTSNSLLMPKWGSFVQHHPSSYLLWNSSGHILNKPNSLNWRKTIFPLEDSFLSICMYPLVVLAETIQYFASEQNAFGAVKIEHKAWTGSLLVKAFSVICSSNLRYDFWVSAPRKAHHQWEWDTSYILHTFPLLLSLSVRNLFVLVTYLCFVTVWEQTTTLTLREIN